jgi:ParB/RepB/Spo0J family partition protein
MPQRTKTPTRNAAPADEPGPCLDTTEIRHLPISLIDPNPWNRTVREEDPDLPGLAGSIRAVGILQPLLVRPAAERFQLLVGRRRMLAAKLAGRSEVPARILVGVDDQLAEEITCIENLQRRNLHFLEEAEEVAKLLRGAVTKEALASRLGRSVSWTCRRARLATLSDRWKELIRDPSSFAASWSAAHCEAVALLEPPAQNQLLQDQRQRLERPGLTVKDLSRLIGDETRRVSDFPWHPDDADLDPRAGACCACAFRSSQNPSLFDPPAEGDGSRGKSRLSREDRCLDSTCAARKLALHLERERTRLAASHDQILQVSDEIGSTVPGAMNEWRLTRVKRATPGAVPGLVVDGPQAGAVRWYRRPAAPAPAPGPRPQEGKRSLADRREQRERQRQTRALGALQAEIRQAPAPPLAVLVRLAIVFGTERAHRRSDYDTDPSLAGLLAGPPAETPSSGPSPRPIAPGNLPSLGEDDDSHGETDEAGEAHPTDHAHEIDDAAPLSIDLWHAFARTGDLDARSVQRCLWARVLPVLILRMTPLPGVLSHVATAWREAQQLAAILKLDAQLHLRQAAEALPDPKSWAAEEREAARSLPSRSPAKAGTAAAAAAPSPPPARERTSAA